MQKTIIIALLVASAICVQVNIKAADGTTAVAGTLAGYSISMGVIQKCHRSCLTCSGVLVTNCLTCQTGITKQTDGKCGCASGSHITAASNALACELDTANSNAGTATDTLCKTVAGWGVNTATPKACEVCADTCGTCAVALATCDDNVAGCWAGLTGASNACTYIISKTMIVGTDQVVDQTGATLSLLNGYFYTATGFIQAPCATGCLTCAANAGCATCATGFTLTTAGTTCECGTGFFHTAATTTALDLCTACGTGASACTSATVATACATSYTMGTSTTESTTCIADPTSSSSGSGSDASGSGSSSDGEASTSATATDAAATSGVLITAASMLLAVILA